jgi:8-oxo-dGTP pyrophosphatase MutT (NUDIX family)
VTDRPRRRERAGVLLVIDGKLALIDRVREGSPPYSTIPGGGVEADETPAEAAVREAREELGLDVVLAGSEPAIVLRDPAGDHHYFAASVVGGTFGPGGGPEWDADRGRGTYTPVLVTPDEAAARQLAPFPVAEAVVAAFHAGSWPATTMELVDPRRTEPNRVRAGAFCLDHEGRILLHHGDPGFGYGPMYETPGGGVEDGETPAEAVVRELEEEAGLHVEIERELATVWRHGGRQHYFLVRPVGHSGRTVLDHEDFFEQVWVPAGEAGDLPLWPKRVAWRFARWFADGRWPDEPLPLTDSILDLRPPCRW